MKGWRIPLTRRKLFHAAAGYQEVRPGLVVEAANLHDRMIMRGVVDKFAVADIHSRMRDLVDGGAEK